MSNLKANFPLKFNGKFRISPRVDYLTLRLFLGVFTAGSVSDVLQLPICLSSKSGHCETVFFATNIK